LGSSEGSDVLRLFGGSGHEFVNMVFVPFVDLCSDVRLEALVGGLGLQAAPVVKVLAEVIFLREKSGCGL
jgi:hypothetical protein